MSARRSFAVSAIFALGACRCDDTPIVVNIADGVVVAAPNADAYVPRIVELGMKRVIIPYTHPSTDVAKIRDAIAPHEDLELIMGLTPARTYEEEWNAPREAERELAAAIERAKVAGDELDGIHLDHATTEAPDEDLTAHLDATLAMIRAELPNKKISYAIRSPDPAWAALLATRVDRLVVHTPDANIKDALALFPETVEVWVAIAPASPLATAREAKPPRVRPPRARDAIQTDVDILRSYANAVLIDGADLWDPARLLAPDATPLEVPNVEVDLNLENRAEDVNDRLRRCCLRDGQVLGVYDHRFERDHGPNLDQEDACELTGLYTAALSFRAAILDDDYAKNEARAAWRALHQLANTTPIKGEVVQSFARVVYDNTRWQKAEDRELYFMPAASIEQLSGWFLGVTVFHDLVADPDEKREIAADVTAVLDRGVTEPAYLQIGWHLTGDERYRVQTEPAQANASSFYPLLMYETDATRRAQLELAFEAFSASKRRDGDVYADTVYGVFHPDRDTGRRALHDLALYRPELTANAALDMLHPGPFVPIEDRPGRVFDFDSKPGEPASITGGFETRFSGVEFLISYWMARYHGLR